MKNTIHGLYVLTAIFQSWRKGDTKRKHHDDRRIFGHKVTRRILLKFAPPSLDHEICVDAIIFNY